MIIVNYKGNKIAQLYADKEVDTIEQKNIRHLDELF